MWESARVLQRCLGKAIADLIAHIPVAQTEEVVGLCLPASWTACTTRIASLPPGALWYALVVGPFPPRALAVSPSLAPGNAPRGQQRLEGNSGWQAPVLMDPVARPEGTNCRIQTAKAFSLNKPLRCEVPRHKMPTHPVPSTTPLSCVFRCCVGQGTRGDNISETNWLRRPWAAPSTDEEAMQLSLQ